MADRVKDHEVTEVIPLDYKVGIEFQYDGCKFVSTRPKKDIYIELEISSWIGISIGAQHCYGALKLPFYSAKCVECPKDSPYWKVGQVSGGSVTSDLHILWQINITRPVTAKDKRLDGGETFRSYRVGNPTDRFDTEAQLIDKAKREFKRIFAPGWILYKEKMVQINKPHEREFWRTDKDILVKANERPKK